MVKSWSLDDGLELVRAIQPETRVYGYHLALGGSVLNNGVSEKDIDLYFLPLDNNRMAAPNPTGLIEWLTKFWGTPDLLGGGYEEPEAVAPFGVIEPEPMVGGWDLPNAPFAPKVAKARFKQIVKPTLSGYKHKFKFNRASGDRIDVFIL